MEGLAQFYADLGNHTRFWAPDDTAARVHICCPQMLPLPPNCVAFCTEQRRTPGNLYAYFKSILTETELDLGIYTLAFDWCCMAAQVGSGANMTSSLLSFALPAICSNTKHLHAWAHGRLSFTLDKTTPDSMAKSMQQKGRRAEHQGATNIPDTVTVIAQVTSAVVAALCVQ